MEAGTLLKVTLGHQSKWPEANIGRFRLAVSEVAKPQVVFGITNSITKILKKEASAITAKEATDLSEYYRTIAPELKPTREALAKVRADEGALDKSLPRTSVMVELEKPRETYRLIRGGFLNKGEVVSAATPAVFHSFPADQPLNRLSFARWLVSANNPLTARVTVNRIWEQYFGIGIVETIQDFGTQGEPPSNQKLLDWLATEFMREGWDLKALHRLIVTSATYRQSSKPTPDLLKRDPYNRLLARGPRVRLEAEMLRDQALAVSGLLSHKLGGPSVMPPQPDGLWQVVYSGDKWETSKNDDKYRRGLYTFWRRSMPHPAMTTFDAPTREYCVLKRDRSNTPLQALVLLNDPEYLEAAQALAKRVLAEPISSRSRGNEALTSSDQARAKYAFELCLGREPRKNELQRLLSEVQKESAYFATNVAAAKTLTATKNAAADSEIVDLATWTVVGNVLLNLDEVVTKN